MSQNKIYQKNRQDKVILNDAELKKTLNDDVFKIARQHETERPYTGKYLNFNENGNYYCKVCGNLLFSSKDKFDSHCGWPSFSDGAVKGNMIFKEDNSLGMSRIEILCGKCNSHLGHIFDDGPKPTGKRYCINGTVLEFEK